MRPPFPQTPFPSDPFLILIRSDPDPILRDWYRVLAGQVRYRTHQGRGAGTA